MVPPKYNKFKGKDGNDYGTFVELETASAEFQQEKLVPKAKKH